MKRLILSDQGTPVTKDALRDRGGELVLEYQTLNRRGAHSFDHNLIQTKDTSYVILDQDITLSKETIEAGARSLLAPGGVDNVTVGLLEADSLLSGEMKLSKPIVSFGHRSGEDLPAITEPEFEELPYDLYNGPVSVFRSYGVKYFGKGNEESKTVVLSWYQQPSVGQPWGNGRLGIRPDLSLGGGVTLGTMRHTAENAIMRPVNHKVGIVSAIGSFTGYGSWVNNSWRVSAFVDVDTVTDIPGNLPDRYSPMIVVKGKITLLGAGQPRVIENFISALGVSEQLRYSSGNQPRGYRFKPKINLDYGQLRPGGGGPEGVVWHYGDWKLAYDSIYPDNRKDEVIDHITVSPIRTPTYTDLVIDEMYLVSSQASGGDPGNPAMDVIRKIPKDNEGFYLLTSRDPVPSEQMTIPAGSATVIVSSRYNQIKSVSGNITSLSFRYNDDWYNEIDLDLTKPNRPNKYPAIQKPLMVNGTNARFWRPPVLANVNGSVQSIGIIHGDEASGNLTRVSSSAVALPLEEFPSTSGTKISEFSVPESTMGDHIPTSPTELSVNWLLEEDSITIPKGSVLGFNVSELPVISDSVDPGFSHVRVNLPIQK